MRSANFTLVTLSLTTLTLTLGIGWLITAYPMALAFVPLILSAIAEVVRSFGGASGIGSSIDSSENEEVQEHKDRDLTD